MTQLFQFNLTLHSQIWFGSFFWFHLTTTTSVWLTVSDLTHIFIFNLTRHIRSGSTQYFQLNFTHLSHLVQHTLHTFDSPFPIRFSYPHSILIIISDLIRLTLHPLDSLFPIIPRFFYSIWLIISDTIQLIICYSVWLSYPILFDTHCTYSDFHFWFDSAIPIQFFSEFMIQL